tara:strand:- start:543 stop:956 length:414 start_codon:yes stop_codon:yes gene_type:complete
MGKILALDYGKKRIGIAISDSEKSIAFPLKTIENKEIFLYLKEIIQIEKIEAIVLGEPKSLNNKENILFLEVIKFKKKIISLFSLPVHLVDERFSSKIASKIILDANIKKMKRRDKSLIDKVSASLILETYLKKKIK